MRKICNVLLIDDHPCILEYYESVLNQISQNNSELKFHIDKAFDYYDGIDKIKVASTKKRQQIIFLDIHLGKSNEGKTLSGMDLGLLINELIPQAKIIVSTFYNNALKVNSIIQTLNPLSLLIKNDFDHNDIEDAIKSIIKEIPYYSKTVRRILRNRLEIENIPDVTDIKLLYELSIGTKIVAMPNLLNMSISGIEKRRRKLKNTFQVKSKEDRQLVLKAKEMGFI